MRQRIPASCCNAYPVIFVAENSPLFFLRLEGIHKLRSRADSLVVTGIDCSRQRGQRYLEPFFLPILRNIVQYISNRATERPM